MSTDALQAILKSYEDIDTNAEDFFEVFSQNAEAMRRLYVDLGGNAGDWRDEG